MTASPAPRPHGDADRIVVHASLRGLFAGALTPTVLIALGGAALADGGYRLFPMLLLVVGSGLAVVVLADLPRRTEFSQAGLTRVCWLRRQHLPWSVVRSIERTAAGTTARTRNLIDRRDGREALVSGGLVARGRGRRRWLLTDRVESRDEHDRLATLLEGLDPPVPLRAGRPHAAAPPTDLYRRRHEGRG